MSGIKGWLIAILLFWVAGACQQAVAFQISFLGVEPDFLLIVLVTTGLFSTKRTGSFLGFLAGLVYGSVAGGHLTAYIATRTIMGFLIGWFAGMEFEGNITVAFIVAAVATIGVQSVFFLMNPHGAIISALLATIGSAMYNGVLAIPLYALLKKVLDSPKR